MSAASDSVTYRFGEIEVDVAAYEVWDHREFRYALTKWSRPAVPVSRRKNLRRGQSTHRRSFCHAEAFSYRSHPHMRRLGTVRASPGIRRVPTSLCYSLPSRV